MSLDITMYSFEECSHGHGFAHVNIIYLLLASMDALVLWPYGESLCPCQSCQYCHAFRKWRHCCMMSNVEAGWPSPSHGPSISRTRDPTLHLWFAGFHSFKVCLAELPKSSKQHNCNALLDTEMFMWSAVNAHVTSHMCVLR